MATESVKLHQVLDYFDEIEKTRSLIRDFVLGGEQRIAMLTMWLRQRAAHSELVIITAGVASTVMRALATAVEEWLPFFHSGNIFDVSGVPQSRWIGVTSVLARKLLIVRDCMPHTGQMLIVDDAQAADKPPSWVPTIARARVYERLKYEHGGLRQSHLTQIGVLLDQMQCARESKCDSVQDRVPDSVHGAC